MELNEIIKNIPKEKIYYQTDLGVLINADCLEILPLIPDNSVDLVLTDPPYGIGADKGLSGFGIKKGRSYNDNWDIKIDINKILIGKNQIIFGGNYYTKNLIETNGWIIWDKVGDYDFKNPYSDCEMAWTSFKRPIKKYTIIQQGFITKEKERFHPTQKPKELFEKILRDYSDDTHLILDPFFGSGTTGLACEKLGRRWIGIEISSHYCSIAAKRIEQEARQMKLFK